MNIIKGIDRIALLIAIIAMIAAFVLAVLVLKSDWNRPLNPEYSTWEKKCDDRIKELEQKNPSIKLKKNIDRLDYILDPDEQKFRKRQKVLENDAILQNLRSRRPAYYIFLPAWMSYVYPIVAALISFMAVLFGIRGATRGIKWISLWIITGFKDEKKAKK
jgi:uncharacterized membrane protein (DUF485 family)